MPSFPKIKLLISVLKILWCQRDTIMSLAVKTFWKYMSGVCQDDLKAKWSKRENLMQCYSLNISKKYPVMAVISLEALGCFCAPPKRKTKQNSFLVTLSGTEAQKEWRNATKWQHDTRGPSYLSKTSLYFEFRTSVHEVHVVKVR